MGVVFPLGLQLRLPRLVHTQRTGSRALCYNFKLQEGIAEAPGLSVFFKDDDGAVYHTYSSYARGNEEVLGAYMYLDLTPKGRNEIEIMDWIRRHDEYPASAQRNIS